MNKRQMIEQDMHAIIQEMLHALPDYLNIIESKAPQHLKSTDYKNVFTLLFNLLTELELSADILMENNSPSTNRKSIAAPIKPKKTSKIVKKQKVVDSNRAQTTFETDDDDDGGNVH